MYIAYINVSRLDRDILWSYQCLISDYNMSDDQSRMVSNVLMYHAI